MSGLESFIWHVLGYSAIPVIIISGVVISALIFYFLVNIFAKGGNE